LTHSRRNVLADGTQMHARLGGLSSLGERAVARLNELGIVIDLAHLGDPGVWQVLEMSRQPIVLSHTSVLINYPGYRAPLLEEDPTRGKTKLRALADNGGVVGIIFCGQADVQAIVREVHAVIEHVGADHVGLGSDFFSREHAPRDMDDIGKLPALIDALSDSGLSDADVCKVMGGNFLRVFEQVWGA
jgi:membrane dipeptidase